MQQEIQPGTAIWFSNPFPVSESGKVFWILLLPGLLDSAKNYSCGTELTQECKA
jgi:hypothetical protein